MTYADVRYPPTTGAATTAVDDVSRWYEYFKQKNGGAEPTEAQADEVLATKHRCASKYRVDGTHTKKAPEGCGRPGVAWAIDLLAGVHVVCAGCDVLHGPVIRPFDQDPRFWENM